MRGMSPAVWQSYSAQSSFLFYNITDPAGQPTLGEPTT